MYEKLFREYTEYKLWKNDSDATKYVDRIKELDESWWTVDSDFIKDIQSYIWLNPFYTWMTVTAENINLSTLKRLIVWFSAKIDNQRKDVERQIWFEYTIHSDDQKSKLSKAIHNIKDPKELQKLLDDEDRRMDFLTQIYATDTPLKRNLLEDVFWVGTEWLRARLATASQETRDSFEDVVKKVRFYRTLDVNDVTTLIEWWLFDSEQIKKIVQIFIPSISLAEALELKVIDEKKSQSMKEKLITKALWLYTDKNTEDSKRKQLQGEIEAQARALHNSDVRVDIKDCNLGDISDFDNNPLFRESGPFYQVLLKKLNASLEKSLEAVSKRWIQSLKETRNILTQKYSDNNTIRWIENLQEWWIIIIKQKQKNSSTGREEEITLYAEVQEAKNNWRFVLRDRWCNSYDDIDKPELDKTLTYSEFVDYISWAEENNSSAQQVLKPTSVEFINKETLKTRITLWDIKDANRRDIFEWREDLLEEEQKLQARLDHLCEWKTEKEQGEIPEIQEIKKYLWDLAERINTLDVRNKETLKSRLDEIDPQWASHGFEIWVVLHNWQKWEKEDFFVIEKIDEVNQTIAVSWLKHQAWNHAEVSFSEFLSIIDGENNEKTKMTRVGWCMTWSKLVEHNASESANAIWKKVVLSNWKLRNKDLTSNKTKNKEAWEDEDAGKYHYDYLISKDSKEGILIHEIWETHARITFLTVDNKEDSKWKKDPNKIIVSPDTDEYSIHISQLQAYISKWKLDPRSKHEHEILKEDEAHIPKADTKFWVGNWLFKGMSFASALQWAKTWFEQITESFKEGDKNKSDQFALKIFWPFLWEEWRGEFRSRIEAWEKKAMDEFVERLSWLDSVIATKLIVAWLKDTNAPQYKKEAGMIYMYKKYGALCAKELFVYQWQYFWYQRMWGIIGDEVWRDTHKKNDALWVNTTEEELVYMLMKKQCKLEWFNGIKRRSKLHKEVKAVRGQGKEDEIGVGLKDWSWERDVRARLRWGIDEMKSWNYPNTIGWLESVTNKGGSMEQMNKIPFLMMFSGMAYNFENDMLDKLKNYPNQSRMLFMLRFISYKNDIALLNETILEICKKLETKEWYQGIGPHAQEIFNMSTDKSIGDKEKLLRTEQFYDKYGEIITNVLYMLNTWDEWDIHNKMLLLEQDSTPVFKKYLDKCSWFFGPYWDAKTNEDLMEDPFLKQGTSWLITFLWSKELFEQRQWSWTKKSPAWPWFWEEITDEIKAVARRDYSEYGWEAAKKIIIKHTLTQFISGIMSRYQNNRELSWYNNPAWSFNILNRWGIYFQDIWRTQANWSDILNGKNQDANELLDRYVKQIISLENGEVPRDQYMKKVIYNDDDTYTFVENNSSQTNSNIQTSVASIIMNRNNVQSESQLRQPVNRGSRPSVLDED